MIGPVVKKLLQENQENFLIPANNVATLMENHPLEHALLVLSKVGYSKIPVLDKHDQFVGLIGLSEIVGKMIDLTQIDAQNLVGLTVKDVMIDESVCINEQNDLEELLHLLVDHAFLPMVNEQQVFVGIVTRKALLKSVNHLAHELERRYAVAEIKTSSMDQLKII
ncbi:MAG: cyclic-di-AMP-binding protein CbpB [Enterococcus sp.]